jgi:flagellar biosynthesis regulator FlbT
VVAEVAKTLLALHHHQLAVLEAAEALVDLELLLEVQVLLDKVIMEAETAETLLTLLQVAAAVLVLLE